MQKCLHSGDPISRYGFCWRRSCRAFSRFDLKLKSQGRPSSGSTTVKSSASPGTRCLLLDSPSNLVTRGGEYISDTTFLKDWRDSRLYRLPILPSWLSSSSDTKSSRAGSSEPMKPICWSPPGASVPVSSMSTSPGGPIPASVGWGAAGPSHPVGPSRMSSGPGALRGPLSASADAGAPSRTPLRAAGGAGAGAGADGAAAAVTSWRSMCSAIDLVRRSS